ncbi:cupin domain-containing protein [Caldimonas caldifontis]|uniref:Cupin n=1 Tax=Caldimonas caldifontis TaxID=1452508 RepID=A0A2S5SRF0_9BURK|nr:cupin domain-containing protein [Caldimonas caldifontis]PPE65279.1 cupin [Caldimonas caldifontis]
MALPHAQARDVIDLQPLGAAVAQTPSTSLIKTARLQLMRVVLRAGQSLPEHQVPGEITIQGLEGEAVVTTTEGERVLKAQQLVLLPGGEPHAVHARTDCSLLVTVRLGGP